MLIPRLEIEPEQRSLAEIIAGYRAIRARFWPPKVLPRVACVPLIPEPKEDKRLVLLLKIVASEFGQDAVVLCQQGKLITAGLATYLLRMTRKEISTGLNMTDSEVRDGGKLVSGIVPVKTITTVAGRARIAADIACKLRSASQIQRPSVEDCQNACAVVWDYSLATLLSRDARPCVAHPRQIAMALSRHLTERSLHDIGRRFANRDHTTVLLAIRKYGPLVLHVDGILGEDRSALAWAGALKNWADVIPVGRKP